MLSVVMLSVVMLCVVAPIAASLECEAKENGTTSISDKFDKTFWDGLIEFQSSNHSRPVRLPLVKMNILV
jgi:hypothetical protein